MRSILNRIKRKIESISKKEMFDYIVGVFTIISVILVYLTLSEMQIQRDNTYRPEIVFETKQIDIEWGNQQLLNEQNPFKATDGTKVNPSVISLNTYNIGVGVAKQIHFSLDSNSLLTLLDHLTKIDKENKYEYSVQNNHITISVNESGNTMFSSNYEVDKLYLLPNAEESFVFNLPMQYTQLIQKIYTTGDDSPSNIPDIKLNLEFSDVQGKVYSKPVILSIELIYLMSDGLGNGCASYNVTMK